MYLWVCSAEDKMKKVALILLICIYSLSSFGIGIRKFYCCGQLKSTDITFVEKEVKENCGKDEAMKSGCCQTKFTHLKIKDSHFAADDINSPVKHFTDLHLFIPSFEVIAFANQQMEISNPGHAPPPKQDIPIYIFCCTFRI